MTQMAVDDGAILMDSTKIIDANYDEKQQVYLVKSEKEEFMSKILIIADGAPSLFANKFNFPKIPSEDMAQTMTYEIEFDSKKITWDNQAPLGSSPGKCCKRPGLWRNGRQPAKR